MYIDKNLEFSDAQAETTQATHASTNDIDLGAAGNPELYLVVSVHAAPTSSGSATINIQLSTSAAANHSSPVILWETGAVAYDNAIFVLGKSFVFKVPKGALRYLRVNYIIGGAALTGGSFDAFLTMTPDEYIGQA